MFSTKENSQEPQSDPFLGKTILSKYTLLSKLGEGSFGKTYSASTPSGKFFAIKFEKRSKTAQLLEIESYILNYLKGPGIPHFECFSSTQDYNLLIMQLLGKSLEKIISSSPSKCFNTRTVCNLAIQMLSILRHIHNNHIIHRDLKPDNFTMGLDKDSNKLYLIDFGLAKKYRSSKTLEQFPLKKGKKLTGTARYASIHALAGYEQSRRDDLESISYVIMFMLKGSLPWQGLPMKKVDERYVKIYEKKKSVSAWELCRGYPKQFEEFVTYTRKLGYKENPNYDYLDRLMRDVLKKDGYEFDYYTEWNIFGSGVSNDNIYCGKRRKKNVLTVDRCYQKNCKTFSNCNYSSNKSNAAVHQSMNNKLTYNNEEDYIKKGMKGNFNGKVSFISFNRVSLPLKKCKSMEMVSHNEIPFEKTLLYKLLNQNDNTFNEENDKQIQEILNEKLKKQSKTLVVNDNNNMDEKVIMCYYGNENKQILNNQNTKNGKGVNDSGINTRRKGNQPLYKKVSNSEQRGSRCCILY